jgi:hypothetical protein
MAKQIHPLPGGVELGKQVIVDTVYTETDAAAAEPLPGFSHLLVSHRLPDGEAVLMLIRPSVWMIVLACKWIFGLGALASAVAIVYDAHVPGPPSLVWQSALLVLVVRFMAAAAVWMSRVYALTDQRVLMLYGVFRPMVADVLLVDVARIRLLRHLHERVLGIGHIEIIPRQEDRPIMLWSYLARPAMVQDRLRQAIHRARSGGRGN